MSRSVAGKFATVVAIAALALIATPPAADAKVCTTPFRASRCGSSCLHAGSPNDVMRGCWRSSCKASSARPSSSTTSPAAARRSAPRRPRSRRPTAIRYCSSLVPDRADMNKQSSMIRRRIYAMLHARTSNLPPSTHKCLPLGQGIRRLCQLIPAAQSWFAQGTVSHSSRIFIACNGSISPGAVPRGRSSSPHCGPAHVYWDGPRRCCAHSRGKIKALQSHRNAIPICRSCPPCGARLDERRWNSGPGGAPASSRDIVDKLNATITSAAVPR